jgi:hypothetical protein
MSQIIEDFKEMLSNCSDENKSDGANISVLLASGHEGSFENHLMSLLHEACSIIEYQKEIIIKKSI